MKAEIAVIGAGYVGLTTAVCLAEIGHVVVCAEVNLDKLELLVEGRSPIHEEGLERLLRKNLDRGRLRFVLGAANAVAAAEFVFLCLPTPQSGDGSADLTYLVCAAEEIADHLVPGSVVINKSTVPVGTAGVVAASLDRSDVSVVSNPEFLREGTAVRDFMNPDRVVVGGEQSAATRVAAIYRHLNATTLITDAASAETIKYAANAFLATKLSFVNDVAAVCERVGADIGDVMLGMGQDRRIGHEFLRPGPGWGGSCFPKDSRALVHIAEEAGHDFLLLRSVIDSNEAQFGRITDKIVAAAGGSVTAVTIGVLGLTFKAGTDDLRDSPAIEIVRRLLERGALVQAFDPTVTWPGPEDVTVCADPYAAATGAAVLVVLTEWEEFGHIDVERIAGLMAGEVVIDTRNVLDPGAVRGRALTYAGMGR